MPVDRHAHVGPTIRGRAERRPLEPLVGSARPDPGRPHRQVLPLADVRLPRRRHARRPALSGGRRRHPLGGVGRRQALDLPPTARRQVPHRRRAHRRGREVQHPARAGAALDDGLRPGAPPARQGDRDAGAGPRRHRHEGRDRDDPDAPVAAPLDRGNDPPEEVRRGQGRRRLRACARRVGSLPVRRAGLELPRQARGPAVPLASRHAEVQDGRLQGCARGDDADRDAPARRGRRRRDQPRAHEGGRGRRLPRPPPPGGRTDRGLVRAALGADADSGQARPRGAEPRDRQDGARRDRLRRPGVARGGPVRPVVVVPRDQVQDHAGDGLRPRSGAREEAPRRRGLRERLPDRHLRLPAPRLPRGAGNGRGARGLLAERGAQATAHSGGLPRVPQAVVRSHGAWRPRLLQHREP